MVPRGRTQDLEGRASARTEQDKPQRLVVWKPGRRARASQNDSRANKKRVPVDEDGTVGASESIIQTSRPIRCR